MKRITLTGLVLAVVCTLGALASASAFAELPEIKPRLPQKKGRGSRP